MSTFCEVLKALFAIIGALCLLAILVYGITQAFKSD